MKLRLSLFLAVISALLAAQPAGTARRPRYGGTLRVEIGAAVASVDPGAPADSPEEAVAREQIDALIYARRNAAGTFTGASGSGPFRLAEWEPGKHAALAANDDFTGGRPFVDFIDIQMGRAQKDRLLDLELGKADFAEISPGDARRAADSGAIKVSVSKTDELLALVFFQGRTATEDVRVRQAIALSVDRAAIVNFILQKQGEPAGGLLPQWSSGTAFLFPVAADAARAKELVTQIGASPRIVLGYDSGGALDESVAKRIAVDAQAAGISLVAQAAPAAPVLSGSAAPGVDLALIPWRMPSPHPRDALEDLLASLGPLAGVDPAPLPAAASPGQIFDRERTVLGGGRVIPVVWLPQVYGLSARVRDWTPPAPGETWPLGDVWLDQETP